MLDTLLELFERDKQASAPPKSGLRGRLSSLLGDDDRDTRSPSDRGRRAAGDRDDDDDRRTGRSQKRERDFFDFGD